jgi:hypothetical protein
MFSKPLTGLTAVAIRRWGMDGNAAANNGGIENLEIPNAKF